MGLPRKTVFKRSRLWPLVVFVAIVGFSLLPNRAYAADQWAVQVHLSSTPSNITVQAAGLPNSSTLIQTTTLKSIGGGNYLSTSLDSHDPTFICGQNNQDAQLAFVVTVTQNGKSLGDTGTHNLCEAPNSGNAVLKLNIPVSSPTQLAQNGTIAGTIYFIDTTTSKNTKTHMVSGATGTIVGPNGYTHAITLDGNGSFKVSNVPLNSKTPYHISLKKVVHIGPENLGEDFEKDVLVTKAGVAVDGGGTASSTNIGSTPAGGQSSGTPNSPSCNETQGFGLSWIICPVFNATAAFSDWVFTSLVQPFLRTSPISTNPSDASFKVWSQFRVYGNVLLVIGLLVLVFGQSIGGGLIDAYTVKKSMPRILIAAILINLSVYIVAGLVDITNVVGGSIGKVMTDPLAHAGAFQFTPSGLQAGSIIGAGAGATFVTVLAVPIATYFEVSIGAFILLFIIMPVVLGLLAAFLTLVIRKAIILALVLVSPVAFAMYCLPNTEKYFKKWWDFLVQTLLVYPIVIIMFAVADILSVTVYDANPHGPTAVVALIVAFVLQFLPLLMIPYAFKLAGGAVGLVHETLTNYHKRGQEAIKGNPNDQRSLRNRVRYGARSTINQGRNRRIDQLTAATKNAANTRGGRFRRGVYTRLGRALNVGNVQADRAQYNREQAEIGDAQRNYGDDSNQRAFWAVQHTGPDDEHGRVTGRYYSPYQSADGSYKEWDPINVAKAHSLVKHDPSRFQDLARYELGKVADDDQLEAFKSRFTERATDLGYSAGDANGVWAGVKFAHHATRKELKHTNVIEDPVTGKLKIGKPDHNTLSTELVDSMRKGDFSGFRSSTAKASLEGYQETSDRLENYDYAGDGNKDKNGKSIHSRQADKAANDNYQDLADYLNKSLFMDPSKMAARQAADASLHAAAADGEDVVGYGVQASQRAEEAWEKFTTTARRPSNGNGGSRGGPAATPPPSTGGGPTAPAPPPTPSGRVGPSSATPLPPPTGRPRPSGGSPSSTPPPMGVPTRSDGSPIYVDLSSLPPNPSPRRRPSPRDDLRDDDWSL